jgi:hypothetical protein
MARFTHTAVQRRLGPELELKWIFHTTCATDGWVPQVDFCCQHTLLACRLGHDQHQPCQIYLDKVGADNIFKTTMEHLSEESKKEVNDMTKFYREMCLNYFIIYCMRWEDSPKDGVP